MERENARITTEALLVQLAVASMLSNKARKAFTDKMKALSVSVSARKGLFD